WRWEHEAYEMSACTDAVKVAEAWNKAEGIDHGRDDFSAWIHEVHPEDVGGFEGHSGNSWDFACRLASCLIYDPAMVVLEHGALTPLVGCIDYGCPHPPPPDVMDRLEELVPGTRERIAS